MAPRPENPNAPSKPPAKPQLINPDERTLPSNGLTDAPGGDDRKTGGGKRINNDARPK